MRKPAVLFRLGLGRLIVVGMVSMPTRLALGEEKPLAGLEELERQLSEAYQAKEFAKALEAAEKMHELIAPTHLEVLYNIACLHSLRGERVKAYEWLEKAVDSGYWDVQHLIQDEDFNSIRKEREFRALAERAWANGYIAMLEREERGEFQKPDEVMAALALKPGERVADIGAGSGYFTIPVAKAVGDTGVVWAIEIRQPMLDYLEKRLKRERLDNVQLKLAVEDDPQLPAGGVDTILMIDTLHYVKDRAAYAKKLRAGLAPGGRVVIIDYIPKPWEQRPWGPLPEQQISRGTVDADMATAGLKPIKAHTFLPEQYFVVYAAE